MIIITQDRKAIHNFDNILSIQVEGKHIVVYDEINDVSTLGTYETQERAIEVLFDIAMFYCGNDYEGNNAIVGAIARVARRVSTYAMPEK